jgi:hypothetical protein
LNKKDLKKAKQINNALDPWNGLELPEQPEQEQHSHLFDYKLKKMPCPSVTGQPQKRVQDPTTGAFLTNPNLPPKQKKVSITRLLEDKLLEWDGKTMKPKAELIADKLIDLAISGYFPAIQEVMDRIDGKITDVHRLEGMAPVTLIFEPAPTREDRKLFSIEAEVRELPEGESC